MARYSQLVARASEFVAEWAQRGEVAIVAPVREAADEIALAACGGALIGVRRFSLRELVAELAAGELNRRSFVPIGRAVREALAARVTVAAIHAGTLGYVSPVAAFPGFPRALAATFEELRLNAVGLEKLRACGDSGPDLVLLLLAYEAELAQRGFADHALRVGIASGTAAAFAAKRALVAVDVEPRTRLERELLDALLQGAPAKLALRIASDGGAEASAEASAPGTSLESLQRYLFSTEAVPERPEDGSVAIFSTSGEALECVEMARRIGAAAERGVAFDQMAILLRSPERYQPLVAEGLRRAGTPMHCTRGSRRPDVAGRSLLALLHCAEERLSASRFAEYLSLGQMPEAEAPRSPAYWERLLVDAAVIGGVGRWETRLAGLREAFYRSHAAAQDEAQREQLDADISALESLRAFALPLIARLAALPERATWGEWLAALGALAEAALRDAGSVLGLLDELEPLAEIGPVGLSEVLLVLGPPLQAVTAAPGESRYGRVWVGGIEEARGMAFRLVFVPGVNEGLFPRPPAEDPLLLEPQRRTLGVESHSDDTGLLQIAAACASEQLALSYSRLDLLTGRERVPSFYVFAAHRAAGAPEMDIRDFEQRARAEAATRIGWPAPRHAEDAIDDAEFDLATLAPLAKGSGQYLKSLPGRAVPALRARWVRWHKPWKAADGLFVEEIGSDALVRYRLTERAWSASQLQQYARCPYRFALRGIFGLARAATPAPIQRMDPAQRGEFFHRVQFELLRGGQAPTLEELDVVLAREAARAEAELAPAIPQIWQAEMQALRADLRGWLQQRALREPEWSAAYAELGFGLAGAIGGGAGHDPRSQAEAVTLPGGYRLRGSIDLVERHPNGALRVVDHKTGRIPEPRPEIAGRGEVLQPLLYAMAAEQMLGETVSRGRLYYSTIAQNYTTIDVPVNEWTRRRGEHALAIIEEAIVNGFLPAAPRKDGCKGCEYLVVCGPYEEERVQEKSQAELKGLKELRSWR